MAKAKKVNKKKSWFSKAWPKIKLGLSALIRNDSAIELRHSKWYAAIIVAIASTILSVVPTLTTYSKLKGSDILASPVAGLNNGLVDFVEKLDDNNIDIIFNGETKTIEISQDAQNKWDTAFPAVNGYHVYRHLYTATTSYMKTATSKDENGSEITVDVGPVSITTEECDLIVYNLSTLDRESFRDEIFGDKTGFKKDGNIAILKGTDPTPNLNNPYATTTMFLGKDIFAIIKSPSGTAVGSSKGYREYAYEGHTFNLRNLVKQDSKGVAYNITRSDISESNYNLYLNAVKASWTTVLDEAWNTTHVQTAWSQTGIWWAIYVGVTLFMGLMFFLFTRGKNNPFSIYTWWECQKIAYWETMTPAILALILGFIMSRFAQLGFIIFFGVRSLWTVFRSLRPQQQ